jgi:hypothetical protein
VIFALSMTTDSTGLAEAESAPWDMLMPPPAFETIPVLRSQFATKTFDAPPMDNPSNQLFRIVLSTIDTFVPCTSSPWVLPVARPGSAGADPPSKVFRTTAAPSVH